MAKFWLACIFGCLALQSLLCVCASSSGTSSFDELWDVARPKTSESEQAQAVHSLIWRLIPKRASNFQVFVRSSVGPPNRLTFKLLTYNSTLQITGSTGVAAAWGFNHYLKYYCNSSVAWQTKQLNIPDVLPTIKTPVVVTAFDKIRYYQNVCMYSYTYPWWNWTRWEQEVDWMAMNGYNFPLAFTGQEGIWRRVYTKLGLTQSDLDAHFAGPAYLTFSRMGNLRHWAGPLPSWWYNRQIELQRNIVTRMRSLGMVPVLPAFAGHVPNAITRLFPKANVTHMTNWGHFPPEDCCTALLQPTDPLFETIGTMFIQEMEEVFGVDHAYNADTFNEMYPQSNSTEYISSVGKAIFSSMTNADTKAIWVLQGWLFKASASFWTPPVAKALLTSVPLGRLLVLDLNADISPEYIRLPSFFGQPFVWCMLHNFGGVLGMYGALARINTGVFAAQNFPHSTMVGTGLTPEGTLQNPVAYDFMNELGWRAHPNNISSWMMEYAGRRYGADNMYTNSAWIYFGRSVYNITNTQEYHNRVPLTSRPSLSISTDIAYNVTTFFAGWANMVKASPAFGDLETFRYDLVDCTREALQVISTQYYKDLVIAVNKKNASSVNITGGKLLLLFDDMETLLNTDANWMVGRWIADSKSMATNDNDKKLLEFNARTLISIWGPQGQLLDYATRQWAGMLEAYYRPRWERFIFNVTVAIENNRAFDQAAYNVEVFEEIEKPFSTDRTVFPTLPTGDTVTVANNIYQRYHSEIDW